MIAVNTGVAIEGLAAFRRALKSISDELPKMLQKELKQAAESAADRARSRYARQFTRSGGRRGASGASKHTVATIRAAATQTSASVMLGGARYPWAAGQEFGSNRFRQFFPYTERGPGGKGSWGRVIFPAVREETANTEADVQRRFDALAKRAYPDP